MYYCCVFMQTDKCMQYVYSLWRAYVMFHIWSICMETFCIMHVGCFTALALYIKTNLIMLLPPSPLFRSLKEWEWVIWARSSIASWPSWSKWTKLWEKLRLTSLTRCLRRDVQQVYQLMWGWWRNSRRIEVNWSWKKVFRAIFCPGPSMFFRSTNSALRMDPALFIGHKVNWSFLETCSVGNKHHGRRAHLWPKYSLICRGNFISQERMWLIKSIRFLF